jgi:hypothetical protein
MTHPVILALGLGMLLCAAIFIGLALRARSFADDVSPAEFARLKANYERSKRAHNGQRAAWRKLSAATHTQLRRELRR